MVTIIAINAIASRLNLKKTVNFSDLLKMAEQKPEDEGSSKDKPGSMRFSLNNIQVINAGIDFMDGPKHTRHEIRDATLTVPFVSNLPYYLDSYVQPAFSAKVNGHAVGFKGSTKPFIDSLETNIDLDLKDVNLPYYFAYSPFPLDFKLASGFLDIQASLSYVQFKDKKPSLSVKGSTLLKTFRIDDKAGNQMINLPQLDITVTSSDLMIMNLHFAKIAFQSPEINVSVDRAGKLNLLSLLPKTEQKAAGNAQTEIKTRAEAERTIKAEDRTPLPLIESDEILVAGGKVTAADASGGRNFRTSLNNVQIKLSHFSTEKDKKTVAEASFQTDTKEEFRLTSNFSVEPLAGEGTVELKQIALKKYAPYYDKFVLFSLEDGRFDFSTKYSFLMTDKEPEVKVSDLAADFTALRLRKHGEQDDFVSLPALSVKETSADLNKREIIVREISAQKGTIVVKRNQDSIVNLQTLLPAIVLPASEPDGAEQQKRRKTAVDNPWIVTAKKVSLDRFAIKAEDQALAEPVSMLFDQVNFRGENISTQMNTKGRISLSLQVEKKGSLNLSGTVGVEPAFAQL